MNVGISVSRVGGSAQIPAMKQVAGGLRLDLAAFRELEAFAQLGSDLDAATQARLDRGYAMNELLKQGVCKPLDVIDEIFVLYAGTHGFIDAIPLKKIAQWESDFLAFLHDRKQETWNKVNEARKLNPELNAEIEEAISAFNEEFKASL